MSGIWFQKKHLFYYVAVCRLMCCILILFCSLVMYIMYVMFVHVLHVFSLCFIYVHVCSFNLSSLCLICCPFLPFYTVNLFIENTIQSRPLTCHTTTKFHWIHLHLISFTGLFHCHHRLPERNTKPCPRALELSLGLRCAKSGSYVWHIHLPWPCIAQVFGKCQT